MPHPSSNSTQHAALKKWTVRSVVAVLSLMVLAVSGGALYQMSASYLEERNIDLPGSFITVNGRDLYVNCQGPTSKPFILLENGLGVVTENWFWVQDDLSSRYRVCAYDRAGTGNSAAIQGPVDAVVSADELVLLLEKLGVTKPVMVVAHSYGALMARVFAQRHPARVAGLILVDSSHEDMAERFPPVAQEGFEQMLNGFGILETLNNFSGARVMGVASLFSDGLAGAPFDRAYHLYASSHHMSGAALEALGWDRSAAAARTITTLGDLPMTVMMVDGWDPIMLPSWTLMQKELSTLSSVGRFVVIKEADHFGALNQQQYARQVVREVDLLARDVF